MLVSNVTSVLWLSLEDYYNKGLTPARAKELIEKIPDPGSAGGLKLYCSSSGLNGNWNVETQATKRNYLELIEMFIEDALEDEMYEMEKEKEEAENKKRLK